MKNLVSIIIPCFNSENTLQETLISVLNQSYTYWEAIIINDGSEDETESIALKYLKKDQRVKYFKKDNGGLGSARNLGLSKSNGRFILPLDSDNKIRKNFIDKSISILLNKKEVGVVYGDALFFGDKTGLWKVGEFSRDRLIFGNYIDACAIYRKDLIDKIGCYSEDLPFQGHEDWDFWLKVLKTNYSFFYLEEITFDYRVSANSMIHKFSQEMTLANYWHIRNKHSDLWTLRFRIHHKIRIILRNMLFQIRKYIKR